MSAPLLPDPPDEELVAEACRGSVRAFECLLERHEGRVLRVLRLMCVPSQDREDVAQEVFVRVFRSLNGFRKGRPFRSWVYKIAVNAAHDYRSRRARRVGDGGWPEGGPEMPAPGEGADAAASRQDLKVRLESALAALTDRERAVFVLVELEGLETREVARALGISAITVRRHLGRARERLRAKLEA